ncbi:hypothetical protein ACFQ7I_18230 [Streptomyces massasporeus]
MEPVSDALVALPGNRSELYCTSRRGANPLPVTVTVWPACRVRGGLCGHRAGRLFLLIPELGTGSAAGLGSHGGDALDPPRLCQAPPFSEARDGDS